MTLNVEAILGEVARKHRLVLSKDDPVISTLLLNEVLLEEYEKRIGELLREVEVRSETRMTKQEHAVTEVVARLNKTLADFRQAFSQELQQEVNPLASALNSALSAEVERVRALQERTDRHFKMSLLLFGTSILMMGLLVAASLV